MFVIVSILGFLKEVGFTIFFLLYLWLFRYVLIMLFKLKHSVGFSSVISSTIFSNFSFVILLDIGLV